MLVNVQTPITLRKAALQACTQVHTFMSMYGWLFRVLKISNNRKCEAKVSEEGNIRKNCA